ncbi:MAG: GTP-binding protein [Promethearchaeota archaeon]
MSFDFLFKCIVVGDGAVGKTAATVRYATGTFADSYKMTIGVDFRVKIITLEGKRIKIQIWDTGGQERFANVRPLYYRGASGAIVMFDITSRDSFLGLPKWFDEVVKYCGRVPWILVGNKLDLENQYRRVYSDEGESFARQMNAEYYECSAKDGQNIETIFRNIALKMFETAEAKKKAAAVTPPTSVEVAAETEVSVVETPSPPISTTIVKPPPSIVSVKPFRYIEETTIPYMLNVDTNEVITQDSELATAFMLSENLRSPEESLEAITKIHWPMYIIPYKGGSFLLDGFKIVSNEFLITQIPAVEEIENILNVSELNNAAKNLSRVKNLLTSLSVRKFTVHALHQPALLRDIIPFIQRTTLLKTVPSYKLVPDINQQVAKMFPSEFDDFSANIIDFREAWSKISDSINTKFNDFQQETNLLGSKIRETYQTHLQELKKEMDQKTISLQVRFEEQLDTLGKSLNDIANPSSLERLYEKSEIYKKECDTRVEEQEELFELVRSGKEQTISFLETTKEKFGQLEIFIRKLEDTNKELLNIIEDYLRKTTTEEKQPEKFVIKDYPTQETAQIGLPFYCIKYVRGFRPRYAVIPPLVLSPSENYSGEKVMNYLFTPTALSYLFAAKIEKKINSNEQFRNILDIACTEENLLKKNGDIKERIQEGLEELFNKEIIDPQRWRWLKTRLDTLL